ncbi:hypothetical protein [Bacillus xiapuensis]|uniref:Uncharacterized protein n=1 Tax=Bacillus xiapuensis TaxID=2014075 RepID=A0ABU6NES3_9BACI|nr:hypothetical protein [Bacillus xiapuensis]
MAIQGSIQACPQTAHYIIKYDPSMINGSLLANDFCLHAEDDFNVMQSWFSGVNVQTPITVTITSNLFACSIPPLPPIQPGQSAACRNGSDWNVIVPDDPSQTGKIRYLVAVELSEYFMYYQTLQFKGKGWYTGLNLPGNTNPNEGTVGEGLSIFLGQQFAIQQNLPNQQDYVNNYFANKWMQFNRPTESLSCAFSQPLPTCPTISFTDPYGPRDLNNNPTYINMAFYILFLYYLKDQLNYSIKQIVSAVPVKTGTITEVYQILTTDTTTDPNQTFLQLINSQYPGTTPLPPNKLSPFPITTTTPPTCPTPNGWSQINGIWYYCQNGVRQTNLWVGPDNNGNWYWVDNNGAWAGFIFRASGNIQYQYQNGSFAGQLATEWVCSLGLWWYFDSNQNMVFNTLEPDQNGQLWQIGPNGACTNCPPCNFQS